MRIVLIEDNKMFARAVIQSLQDEGHAVDWLADGSEGERFLTTQGADLAIVDINLPEMSGLGVIQSLLRKRNDIPVLVVTARSNLEDRVIGLDAGADDYMTKPLEMDELKARVRALGRRRGQRTQNLETIGELRYDRLTRRLLSADGPILLPRRELALWEALLDQAERVVSKDALCDSIYGTGADIEVNAVELLVSRLRRKIETHNVTISSIRGLGYILRPLTLQQQ